MEIDREKCTDCGVCVENCISGAIDLSAKAIDERKCSRCGHCLAYCPAEAVSMPGKIVPPHGDTPGALQFEALVRQRRSCRNYTDRPVPAEILNSLTDTVRYAPTGTNTQAVVMSVLSNRETVKKLADTVYRFFLTLSRLVVVITPFLWLALGRKRVARIIRMKRYLSRYAEGKDIFTYGAPVLIAFHAPSSSSTPEEDCVIWATTAVYHAETLGLGSCWSGFIKYAARSNAGIRRELGIPKGNKIFSVVILGFPLYKPYRGVIRKEAKIISMN
jgi:nitroreductase/NAD-dependent dihydropyrimidine dehydrogenase PreA subunit